MDDDDEGFCDTEGYSLSDWVNFAEVGWDEPLQTYFLQAIELDDGPVWWFGQRPREIPTFEDSATPSATRSTARRNSTSSTRLKNHSLDLETRDRQTATIRFGTWVGDRECGESVTAVRLVAARSGQSRNAIRNAGNGSSISRAQGCSGRESTSVATAGWVGHFGNLSVIASSSFVDKPPGRT